MVKKKYRALRFIAFLLQVFAWVTLVLTVLGAVGAIVAGATGMLSIPALEGTGGLSSAAGILAGIISAVAVLIGGVIVMLCFLASGEYVYVQLDIEHNTRQLVEYMRQSTQAQMPSAEPYAATPTTPAPVARQ